MNLVRSALCLGGAVALVVAACNADIASDQAFVDDTSDLCDHCY